MATLTGSTIAATYDRLLALPSGGLNGATLVAITDGNASATCALSVATTSIAISATDKFYLDDGGNTYIYESAADIMDFYVGGVHLLSLDDTNSEVVVNEGSADVNFRVEGNGDANLLFCDAGNDRIGIGTNAPAAILEVSGDTGAFSDSDATANAALILENSETADSEGVGILFKHHTSSTGTRDCAIVANRVSSTASELHFITSSSATGGTTASRMVIDEKGEVGIGVGTNSVQAMLEVENITIDTDNYVTSDDFYGIRASFIYTGSASKEFGNDDNIQAIRSKVEFNDAVGSGTFNHQYGVWSLSQVTDCTEGGVVGGIYGSAQLAHADADVDTIRAGHFLAYIIDGTVDGDIYGVSSVVDVETEVDAAVNIVGVNVQMNNDKNPSGYVAGLAIFMNGASDDYFWYCYDDVNNDVTGHLTADAGVLTVDSSAADGASDYAEYFESKDGDAIAIGVTVKLDGDKIVACSDSDTPIGVVRPKDACVVSAGGRALKWQGKYLLDDYDAPIMEDFTFTTWTIEVPFSEYHEAQDTSTIQYKYDDDNDKYYIKYHYQTDKIPSDLTVPGDATIITPTNKRKKVNPDYNESLTYVKRADRDEWCLVGLLGQVPITKGQPTASNWVKMKDVSSSVEMWLIK